jgi:hypothetical protein
MIFWTARFQRAHDMSEPEARGPEDYERHGVARSQQCSGYSRTITFSSEECTFRSPLYSISPSLRNLFMK